MKIQGTIHFRIILPHVPGFQQEPQSEPVCSHSPDCKDCPYPRHGFLCWGADGTCPRSRMNEINKRRIMIMMSAVLSNPDHPEYGVATIPFPILHDQYAYCVELLEALEIGDAVKADCKVEKVNSFYDVLKRTEMLTVNVEELNYLAKRLNSFDTGEASQFQAMAHKLELFELKDLINLTFGCQEVTVISDFSDLPADEEYLPNVKKYLGIDDFTQAQIRDIRFKVPYIGETAHAMDCPSIEGYNEFAEELGDIWQKNGML